MQKATRIVIESKQCREASRNFFPIDPDELFNQTWLKLKEKELKDESWRPNNAVAYFLTMMRHEAIAIKQDFERRVPYDTNRHQVIEQEQDERIRREIALLKWINSPSENEDLLFYKNIILITLYSKDINSACEAIEIERAAFWRHRKEAMNKFYEDTNYRTTCDILDRNDLV